MSDIDVVYKSPIWRANTLIEYLASVLSNEFNRITVNMGKPLEVYEIVGNGYNQGYSMKHTANTVSVKFSRIDRRDQLHAFLTRLIVNERFSSFTYIPRLGNTMTVFRHQITFDNTNSIDRRRFAEWGAPFGCCDRLDGCCTPQGAQQEMQQSGGQTSSAPSVYRQESTMRAPLQSRIPLQSTSTNAMNLLQPKGVGMSRR